jgi:hypothetical protein
METPIVCDLNAIPPEQRERHASLANQIFDQIESVTELADGFLLQLPATRWENVVEWARLEQLCCPFFNFRLELLNGGEFRLSLTGPEGVKDLLRSELDSLDVS